MRIIGITGGIGTGKSTVSSYLRGKGFDVIDADAVAGELAEEQSVLDEIRDYFGDEVLTAGGTLDRKKMARIVFADAGKKEMLESIITSRVVMIVSREAEEYRSGKKKASKGDVVFLDAPTLFETGADRLCDEVWLVSCGLETRISRAEKRDGARREELIARIASQMSEDEKAERADRIIYNDGSKEELYEKIDDLLAGEPGC